VLLPAATLLPSQTIPVPSWIASPLLEPPAHLSTQADAVHERSSEPAAAMTAVAPPSSAHRQHVPERDIPWWSLVLLVWLCGALLRLMWLALLLVRMRRLNAHGAGDAAHAQAHAARLARAMRVRVAVRVQYSALVTMPCTSGVLRPVILLPRSAGAWPEERLRVVLLHELAHIRRNDYAVWLLTELACALYWINPVMWLARVRVHAEQEQACDDEVLGHGVSPIDYAQHLLDVARSFYLRRRTAGAALSLAREATLKERVRAILDLQRDRRRRATRTGAFAIAGLALWVMSVSVLRASAVPAAPAAASATEDHVTLVQPWNADHGVTLPLRGLPIEVAIAPAVPLSVADKRAAPVFLVSDASGNEVHLSIDAADARYYLWARVRVGNRDANSFAITVGDGALTWHVDADDRDDRGVWRWERVEIDDDDLRIDATAGAQVTLRAAEQGAEVDAALLTSDERYRPRGADPVLPPAQTVELWLEAEDALVTAPFVQERDRRAANGSYLRVAGREHSRNAPPQEGTATFALNVPRAGTYLIWARTRIDDDDEDSFWVRANDGAWFAWNGIEADDDWEWSAVRAEGAAHAIAIDLRAGDNTITFAYREPGARLDRLLITNDPRLTPRNARTQQGNRPQP
jgi:beta-lactamase regulating signal transducer with metallopeptidase domain